MQTETIIADIKHYIESNILSPEIKINDTTNLQDAGVDSFSTVEIILFIERKYGVVIPDEKLIPDNFKTLQSLSKVVQQLLSPVI